MYSECERINLLFKLSMFLYCSEANVFGRWNLQGQGFASFDHTLVLPHSHVDRYHFIVDFSLLVSGMRFTSKECLSLWLFLSLTVWKFGRENGVVVVSQRPVGNVLTFTPHLGQDLNSFSKQNLHLEQNEHGPSEAMFDALVRLVNMARRWCINAINPLAKTGIWTHFEG